jgi:8-oxo-dGTP pyrophosphatase MutT (NUDIX family)
MKKPLRESAVAIIKNSGTGRILFLERKEGWCLPGGKRDDEESIVRCAYRELEEETGIKMNSGLLRFLGTRSAVNGRLVYVFVGEYPLAENDVSISKEHTAYKWVDPKDMYGIGLAGNTGHFLNLLNQ